MRKEERKGEKEKWRKGERVGRREGMRERARARDPPVGKLFTENINSTKSIKRAFFPLKMKKNTVA